MRSGAQSVDDGASDQLEIADAREQRRRQPGSAMRTMVNYAAVSPTPPSRLPTADLPSTSASVPLDLDRAADLVRRLQSELRRAFIGQDDVVDQVLLVFLAGGHCLLRGVPGLAKTLLIKTLAQAVHLTFNRIQFTPDLMPSDIPGTEVIEEDRATGKRELRFLPGPVFANILLADEINRTPPKTQAALLEAMQEQQVTVGGVRYPLEARSSCWRRRTRSSRKARIRCPKPSSIASCSTS